MTLDLVFKDLVDVAARGSSGAGRPLRIAIDSIDEDPDQPRRLFSEQELDELSQSIREHGVLQPFCFAVPVTRADTSLSWVRADTVLHSVRGCPKYQHSFRTVLSRIDTPR